MKGTDPGQIRTLHRFPADDKLRAKWLNSLHLKEEDISPHSRVCNLHFRDGNTKTIPSVSLGIRLCSPPSYSTPRGKRAANRSSSTESAPSKRQCLTSTPISTPPMSTSSTPLSSPISNITMPSTHELQIVSPSESIAESDSDMYQSDISAFMRPSDEHTSQSYVQVVVNSALASQLESVTAEKKTLEDEIRTVKSTLFRIENIAHNDSLVSLYTGFISYEVFLAFYTFLGSATENLQYWGSSGKGIRKRKRKLDPPNQLFITLIKLKLDPPFRDLAHRFQVSQATISRYFITWVCFLYKHFSEIDWFPSKRQILATLPSGFREKYPTTVAIIDASEVFIETPSDLMLQSTSWSSYKHHNTLKFLVACTPNGAISYISPAYLGSVSDPTLTKQCGFLLKLEGMAGMSVMADRGFTIKEELSKLGLTLNLPPFMEGRGQLPAAEVQTGRSISSLRIHVERAIGRMKSFKIMSGVFPLKMSRLANQIVTVCALLTNFQPALVPPTIINIPSDDLSLDDADSVSVASVNESAVSFDDCEC